ncbi:hypothetical protein PRCB_06565 [Pantoea rodasii]|uniref:Uncharacterized protein n=1 Tax=Pantoea rodasii TaxID=1076549 RepID=A0A2M9WFP4_9GAMM|nr:hypothetical protein PRCB_06565 [Pantoea rodasii]
MDDVTKECLTITTTFGISGVQLTRIKAIPVRGAKFKKPAQGNLSGLLAYKKGPPLRTRGKPFIC